ncbi:hypothetical protein J5N97_021399 [Dioscorea zingiberensis]|uniref:Uncharacterized protein n=1 Tax=Dioscorea zingiberensis TaxID=325984 RepID=A0A9D5HEK2_9LILI|nr:hypothetical protein J5N97_021399 [Dioscorea zingiberensis]
MGDSTAMTIEFLRARLLSERSVSRTSRQRADQLAQRVMELEDQLRIIGIQRRKAEKAAAEVLAILECQGVGGDFSEVISSSSEHDEDCDKWEENGSSQKGDEASRVSTMEGRLSGSEVEGSVSQGRSLSWKSRSDSPNSRQKMRLKQLKPRPRRSSLFSRIESSGKLELGKSCRRIKRRDTGSANEAEDEADKTILDANEKREVSWPNQSDDQAEETSKDRVEKAINGALVSLSLDDVNKETSTGFHGDGGDRDDDIGKVIEKEDLLIDWYQAEETAQREWEEKYNARKSYIMSSSETSQPAIAEMVSKSEESGAQDPKEANLGYNHIFSITEPAVQDLPDDQRVHGMIPEKSTPNQETVAVGLSNGSVSPDLEASTLASHTDTLAEQQYNRSVAGDARTSSHEFSSPAKEKILKLGHVKLDEKSDSCSHSSSTWSPSSENSTVKVGNLDDSEIKRQLLQKPSDHLESVLNSLQRAKISLRQRIYSSPSRGEGLLATTLPTYSQDQVGNLDIPSGTGVLFRLPTDSFPQDDRSRPNFYGSGLSLTSTDTDVQFAISTNGYRQPISSYVEAGPRASSGHQFNDPHFMSSSNRYSLPTNLTTEAAPFHNRFMRTYPDARNEMLSRDQQYLYRTEMSWFDANTNKLRMKYRAHNS